MREKYRRMKEKKERDREDEERRGERKREREEKETVSERRNGRMTLHISHTKGECECMIRNAGTEIMSGFIYPTPYVFNKSRKIRAGRLSILDRGINQFQDTSLCHPNG